MLEAARRGVSGIKKAHLDELRHLGKPPEPVQLAMEGVRLLLSGEKEDWDAIRRAMGKGDFIQSILQFDSRKLEPKLAERVQREYISRREFSFEVVNHASKACGPMVTWVVSISSTRRWSIRYKRCVRPPFFRPPCLPSHPSRGLRPARGPSRACALPAAFVRPVVHAAVAGEAAARARRKTRGQGRGGPEAVRRVRPPAHTARRFDRGAQGVVCRAHPGGRAAQGVALDGAAARRPIRFSTRRSRQRAAALAATPRAPRAGAARPRRRRAPRGSLPDLLGVPRPAAARPADAALVRAAREGGAAPHDGAAADGVPRIRRRAARLATRRDPSGALRGVSVSAATARLSPLATPVNSVSPAKAGLPKLACRASGSGRLTLVTTCASPVLNP